MEFQSKNRSKIVDFYTDTHIFQVHYSNHNIEGVLGCKFGENDIVDYCPEEIYRYFGPDLLMDIFDEQTDSEGWF